MRKRLQRLGNRFTCSLLRSRLHRLASGSLMLVTYRGRRSGDRFTIPVMYVERDGALTIWVGHPERKRWWCNFRDGLEVEVLLRGRRLRGHAQLIEADSVTIELYLSRFPRARGAIEASDSPTFVRVSALKPDATLS